MDKKNKERNGLGNAILSVIRIVVERRLAEKTTNGMLGKEVVA